MANRCQHAGKLLLVLSLLQAASALAGQEVADAHRSTEVNRPPNILLVLADDLGFTDLGAYGSEINTPTLDSLAREGIRFTNYHTAANCAPARAMLLTGVDAHLAGVPNIAEMLVPEQTRYDHYRGTLGDNVVTVATLLESAGYHTYMAGKWHLGTGPGELPSERGFERTVALADSGADNWEQRPYLPLYDKANWYADGAEYQLPEDFYSSRFLVDKMIEFVASNLSDGRPFFAYLPFQAVHIPVQAPQAFIDRYSGTYDRGWDVLREERLRRAIALGIVPDDIALQRMPTTADWDALTAERRRYESKRMAVYAAMVEAMDHHLGRLLEYLKSQGQYDNTVIVFTSDNGTEASGLTNPTSLTNRLGTAFLGYHTDYDRLGLQGSYNSISASFASASASPLAYYKFYVGEGGMRVPLIMAGPGLSAEGVLSDAFSFVTDITPTLLSLAGVEPPGRRYAGRDIEKIIGRDLGPLLRAEASAVYGPEDTVGYELAGHAALFQGEYKLRFVYGPLGDGEWHLYNIVRDPGETRNLASEQPARLQRMRAAYEQYKRDNKVLDVPRGFDHLRQVTINTLHKRLRAPTLVALITGLILLPFAVAWHYKKRDAA